MTPSMAHHVNWGEGCSSIRGTSQVAPSVQVPIHFTVLSECSSCSRTTGPGSLEVLCTPERGQGMPSSWEAGCLQPKDKLRAQGPVLNTVRGSAMPVLLEHPVILMLLNC